MRDARHWANLIQNDLSDSQSLADESRYLILMVEQIQADARSNEPELHGWSCPKVQHGNKSGFLHGACDDDGPYDVDGVRYCGRCHWHF